MCPNEKLIRIQDVTKVFSRGTVDEVVALNNISLDINSEDYITVIGSNGAGKTTLLNVIAGRFPPEKGKIIIDGADVTNLPEHRRACYIGRVHQDPKVGTCSRLMIEENLAFALVRGQPRGLKIAINEERRELFRSFLAPFGWDWRTG